MPFRVGRVRFRLVGSIHAPVVVRATAPRAEGTVDTNSLERLRSDFVTAPTARWGAIVSSIGSAVTYFLLLLLLYLFVDLLVWRGEIPTSFAQLSAARKREFADEWEK